MFQALRSWFRGDDLTPPAPTRNFSTLAELQIATALQNRTGISTALLAQTAVYRGVQLITDLMASIPWYGMRGGEPALSGLATLTPPSRLNPQPQLLLAPNPFETRDATIRRYVESLLWHGNAYLWGALFDPLTGRPSVVMVVDPTEVTVTKDTQTGRPLYEWQGRKPQLGVNWWHDQLVTVPGEVVGVSPLTAGAPVVRGNIAADSWTRDLFTDSGIPSGVLETPGMLTKPEADDLKAQWLEQHADTRSPAILSGGMTYHAIQLTPEQAQFIMTRSYGTQEVARLLGIPQWLVNAGSPPGSGSALTYQNLSAVFTELAKATLLPTYARRLQVTFSGFLPRGQSVQLDVDELVRADREARFRAWDTATGGRPIMTVAEVREREGLDPLTEVQSDAAAAPVPDPATA